MPTSEQRIQQLAADNLATETGQQLNLDGDVADTGLSSVAIVSFVRMVGQEFNVELPPADVAQMKSLRDLVNYIDAKSG